MEAANTFLQTFLVDHIERFAVKPAKEADLHHAAPSGATLRAAQSIVEERTVGNDYCLPVESDGRRWRLAALASAPLRRAGGPRQGRRTLSWSSGRGRFYLS
jgi:hypothetical protein